MLQQSIATGRLVGEQTAAGSEARDCVAACRIRGARHRPSRVSTGSCLSRHCVVPEQFLLLGCRTRPATVLMRTEVAEVSRAGTSVVRYG